MTESTILFALGLAVVVSPASLVMFLGLPMACGMHLPEKTQANGTKAAVIFGLLAAVAMLGWMLWTGERHVPIELGNWVSIDDEHFHFHLKFVFDRLSVPFTILTLVLCGTVAAFAHLYLHREEGYGRFFLLYSFFLLGMILSSLAGTIETLFFGWELVGLSSALLVAYFQQRPAPVRNAHRIWSIYRVSDAAFLIAALTLHHLTGAGDFEGLMGSGAWPEGVASIGPWPAFAVGMLLLLAAAGKSGMVPFSGWLPRAMEGPTPSSAVFYGALSVHLGTYLLLRVSPLLEVSLPLRISVITLGAISAVFGTICSRVQTDVKNALAFASLTQVSIITIEIGLGLYYIALVHMIGHACLRTLQLLRSPSVLRDHQMLEDAVGARLTGDQIRVVDLPTKRQVGWYRFALHRGYLDGMLDRVVVTPVRQAFLWCDRMERRWTDLLSGGPSRSGSSSHSVIRNSHSQTPYEESLEEVV